MTTYAKFSVSITSMDADEDGLLFMKGWLREAARAALLGHQRERFKFKDDFADDIVVEIEETA